MNGHNQGYVLRVSGIVNDNNRREFEQTVQFIINHLPSTCVTHELSVDVHQPGEYHFLTLWKNLESLNSFKEGAEFNMLNGAFETLGRQYGCFEGLMTEINPGHLGEVKR